MSLLSGSENGGTVGLRDRLGQGSRSLIRQVLPSPAHQFARRRYRGLKRAVGSTPGRGRVLPDYLIIGAAKCGTTTLSAWLNEHPFISPASRKEVHYFDYSFHLGEDWYRSNFPRDAIGSGSRIRTGARS